MRPFLQSEEHVSRTGERVGASLGHAGPRNVRDVVYFDGPRRPRANEKRKEKKFKGISVSSDSLSLPGSLSRVESRRTLP